MNQHANMHNKTAQESSRYICHKFMPHQALNTNLSHVLTTSTGNKRSAVSVLLHRCWKKNQGEQTYYSFPPRSGVTGRPVCKPPYGAFFLSAGFSICLQIQNRNIKSPHEQVTCHINRNTLLCSY